MGNGLCLFAGAILRRLAGVWLGCRFFPWLKRGNASHEPEIKPQCSMNKNVWGGRGGNYLGVQSSWTNFATMRNKISVEQYAASGAIISRRGKPVSASYIYRMIRQHLTGRRLSLPFRYELTGDKDRIWILTWPYFLQLVEYFPHFYKFIMLYFNNLMLNRKIALVQSSKLKYLALSSFNGGELGDSNAMAFGLYTPSR